MPRLHRPDRRGAELKAAAKRGQVHADLFGTLRAVALLTGLLTTALAGVAILVGYSALWILVPVVIDGRTALGAAAAVLALGGLGLAWSGISLCARARDVATFRARMAGATRAAVLCGAPGALCGAWLIQAGAAGVRVHTLAWIVAQLLIAPLGLAAVFACARAAAPRDRRPDHVAAARPSVVGLAVVGVMAFLAALPVLMPSSLSYWPHTPLPADPERAVHALDARHAWEQGWRFRTAHGFPWSALFTATTAIEGLPTLDAPVMSPVRAQEAIAEIAREARESPDQAELLLGLIASPTVPVRIRESAIEHAVVLRPLPPEFVAALVAILHRPNVDLHADLSNWWRRESTAQTPLIAAEDRLRLRALETLFRTRTRTPAVLAAMRAQRDHPRLDVVVRSMLQALEREADRDR